MVFSSFRIDLRAGELIRAGTAIPLRPKTWAVLLFLAERPGMLVTRDELLDAIWPDVAVTPETVTKSISELRLALGDDAAAPRFIATVHRRGFRFLPDAAAALQTAAPVAWHETSPNARPFVGRAVELDHLKASFLKASRGERQTIFVTGPPGIGKTTVIEALLDRPELHRAVPPVWIARAACVEQHGPREPYMPVLEALERLARRTDASGLASLLRRTAPTWLAQMPWLIGDDGAELQQALQATRPERMLREFAAFTDALTTDITLVLVLEDLHWCDPATVDLLALLGEHREPARLLIIGTYRPAELVVREHVLARAVRTMLLRRQCAELPIHEFEAAEVQRYLEARFPGIHPPPTLVQRLHRYTDGNPLFVAALVEHMVSRGWILDTDPGWGLVGGLERIDLGVPDDVRRMIATQLESLAPADLDLLGAASVIGIEFTAQAISGALRCDLDEIEARCERQARSQRFVRFAGSSEWPDGSTALRYCFTHELYRQCVYEGVSAPNRQRLHQRLGEALEGAYGDRAIDIAAELAVHFEHGGDIRRTLRYLAMAAQRSRLSFAGRVAIGYLEAAIALVARLPSESERQGAELDLRMQLASSLGHHLGFGSDVVRQNCERAYELCQVAGSPARRFEVLYALCHVHAVRADGALLDPGLAELAMLAEQLDSTVLRLLSDSAALRMAAHGGRLAEARALAEAKLEPLRAIGLSPHPPPYGGDPIVAMAGHYAFAMWYLGERAHARAITQANLIAAGTPNASKFTQATALALAALVEMLDRNASAVRHLTERLLALTAEQAFPLWDAVGLGLYGWAQACDGELDNGIETLERARTELAATGARMFSTYILAFLSEARLQRGDRAAGLADIEEALRVAETTVDRSYWPELWRLKGELLLTAAAAPTAPRRGKGGADRDWPAAEHCFLEALEVARASQAKSLELRAANSLARAWLARDRGADAQDLLEPLCRWFGTATGADLDEARTLLARMAGDSSRSRFA